MDPGKASSFYLSCPYDNDAWITKELHKQLAPMKLSTKFWPVNILVLYIKLWNIRQGDRGIHRDMPTGSVCICVCVDINSHGDFNIYEPFQPVGIYTPMKTRSTLYSVWLVYETFSRYIVYVYTPCLKMGGGIYGI